LGEERKKREVAGGFFPRAESRHSVLAVLGRIFMAKLLSISPFLMFL
jgi:hypothetical protein